MTDQIFGGTGGGACVSCSQYGNQCKCFEKWDAMAKRILAKHHRQPCVGCGCVEECRCLCDKCPAFVSSVDVWKMLDDIRENGNGTSVSFPYETLYEMVQVLINNHDESVKRIAELTEALDDITAIAEVGMEEHPLKFDLGKYGDHMRYLDTKNIATMAIAKHKGTK